MQSVTTIGLDIALVRSSRFTASMQKEKVVIREQLKGVHGFSAFFGKLSPCVVGIEASDSSHHWSREPQALGHTVKLMPPSYVKPYVKRHKNDVTDEEGSQRQDDYGQAVVEARGAILGGSRLLRSEWWATCRASPARLCPRFPASTCRCSRRQPNWKRKYRDWQTSRRNPLPSGTIAVPQRCSLIFRPNSVAAGFVFKGATGVRCSARTHPRVMSSEGEPRNERIFLVAEHEHQDFAPPTCPHLDAHTTSQGTPNRK